MAVDKLCVFIDYHVFAVAVGVASAVLAESAGVAESAGKAALALNPLFGLALVGEFVDCFYIAWEDAAWSNVSS